MGWVDKVLEVVQKLGGLAPAAIFALGDIVLAWYVWQIHKDETISNEKWRETREKQIASEVSHTEAIQLLTQKIGNFEMALMKYLIKE